MAAAKIHIVLAIIKFSTQIPVEKSLGTHFNLLLEVLLLLQIAFLSLLFIFLYPLFLPLIHVLPTSTPFDSSSFSFESNTYSGSVQFHQKPKCFLQGFQVLANSVMIKNHILWIESIYISKDLNHRDLFRLSFFDAVGFLGGGGNPRRRSSGGGAAERVAGIYCCGFGGGVWRQHWCDLLVIF